MTDTTNKSGSPERFEVRVMADSHFGWLRTRLSLERTMMAGQRMAISLIGFGFAIVQFFEPLEPGTAAEAWREGARPKGRRAAMHAPDSAPAYGSELQGPPTPDGRSRLTFGTSPVRERRTPGSARGAVSNHRPYRDRNRSWAGQRLTWKVFHQIRARAPLLQPKLRLPYRELQALAVL